MTTAAADGDLTPTDPVRALTVPDVLAEHRRSRPGGRALVCGKARITYADLDDRTDRLARALLGAGMGRGDRLAWLGQNCHRLVESWLACTKIGAVVVPANWRQSADELVTMLEDSQPSVIVWQQEEIGDTVADARARWAGNARWLQHDGGTGPESYEGFLAGGPEASAPVDAGVSPTDPVLQLYTGAFGGTPNGALLSHQAIIAQSLVVAMVQRVDGDTAYLNSGPMFHMATLMTTFATFQMGGTNVLTRRVDAEELCRVIAAEGCNYGFVMGPTAEEIMAVNADGRYDLSGFRTFGGNRAWNAMVTVDDSPWGVHPAGYGQTEVTGMLTYNALGVGTEGTSGRPSPWSRCGSSIPRAPRCPTARPARSSPAGRSSPTATTPGPLSTPSGSGAGGGTPATSDAATTTARSPLSPR